MEIDVLLEGEGATEVEVIQIVPGVERRVIVEEFARRRGFVGEAAFLFLEDEDAPLDLGCLVTETEDAPRVHHVHRVGRIDVTIYYKGEHKSKEFSPATRIQSVLDWAVGLHGYALDPTIAPEMELALHGQETPLPKNAHIGRFVRHPDESLSLDLVRGVVPNGASR